MKERSDMNESNQPWLSILFYASFAGQVVRALADKMEKDIENLFSLINLKNCTNFVESFLYNLLKSFCFRFSRVLNIY